MTERRPDCSEGHTDTNAGAEFDVFAHRRRQKRKVGAANRWVRGKEAQRIALTNLRPSLHEMRYSRS